jgi:hypothetical protein
MKPKPNDLGREKQEKEVFGWLIFVHKLGVKLFAVCDFVWLCFVQLGVHGVIYIYLRLAFRI